MTDPKLLARLRSFRQELYDDLGLRQDSLFELVDAVLTAPERRTLVRLSLCPCFRRRWPSTCDALADGTLDVGGLRALFQAHVPLPGPGERPLWALDGTHWPRPAAATSPARTWEHRPLPGKPQQGVVPAWAYHWLVQVPEAAGSWVLPLDVQRRRPPPPPWGGRGRPPAPATADPPRCGWPGSAGSCRMTCTRSGAGTCGASPWNMPSDSPNRAWAGRRCAPATQRRPTAGPGCSLRCSGSSGWPGQSWRINACPGSGRGPPNASHPGASSVPSVDLWAPLALLPRR